MPRHFVSEALQPIGGSFDPAVMSRGEPALPAAFEWKDDRLTVCVLLRTWRSTRTDRGEAYLARHWFEIDVTAEHEKRRRAVVYFERQAPRRAPRWWLYTIDDPA